MIPDQWYPVLSSKDLRRRPVGVTRMGERVVFWRDAEGRVAARRDRCPHRGVALSRGRVRPDGCLQCPYHGFAFNRDGACVDIPVNGPDAPIPPGFDLEGWPVTEQHGLIWLWWGEPRERYPEVPWFDRISNDWSHNAEHADVWPVNHVRLTESFFDIHHFRWVHGSVFPGVGAVLEPYEVHADLEAQHIVTRGTLRHADKATGLPFEIELRFPNVVLLHFTEKLKLLAIATPITERESWVWIRYHQEYLPVPGLGSLLAWLSCQLEMRVVQRRQDLPIMMTQEPKLPTPGCDRLVKADAGTAAYLRLRRRLMRAKESSPEAEAS
ncbi:MAG: aromatic ring-hydroxylating dioxygenase subunit alpha [Alphaproteobacteria bacterium]|nr:aromatic ring-hydroxylating dioxygenase subunit alpha [Alphaproteobacteria bacterium]